MPRRGSGSLSKPEWPCWISAWLAQFSPSSPRLKVLRRGSYAIQSMAARALLFCLATGHIPPCLMKRYLQLLVLGVVDANGTVRVTVERRTDFACESRTNYLRRSKRILLQYSYPGFQPVHKFGLHLSYRAFHRIS